MPIFKLNCSYDIHFDVYICPWFLHCGLVRLPSIYYFVLLFQYMIVSLFAHKPCALSFYTYLTVSYFSFPGVEVRGLVTADAEAIRFKNGHEQLNRSEEKRPPAKLFKSRCLQKENHTVLTDNNSTLPQPHTLLFADDIHKVIYCIVPKAGSTSWKQALFSLNTNLSLEKVIQMDMKIHNAKLLSSGHLNALDHNHYDNDAIEERMQTYKKFMFVRHPFDRLWAAFRHKFGGHPFKYLKRFASIAMDIVKQYRRINVDSNTLDGIHIEFVEFLQYVADLPSDPSAFDVHWRRIWDLCRPCDIDYDFIGHVETIETDAKFVFEHLLKVPYNQFIFPHSNSVPTHNLKDIFQNIPKDLKQKLYEIYQQDFDLFGYEMY